MNDDDDDYVQLLQLHKFTFLKLPLGASLRNVFVFCVRGEWCMLKCVNNFANWFQRTLLIVSFDIYFFPLLVLALPEKHKFFLLKFNSHQTHPKKGENAFSSSAVNLLSITQSFLSDRRKYSSQLCRWEIFQEITLIGFVFLSLARFLFYSTPARDEKEEDEKNISSFLSPIDTKHSTLKVDPILFSSLNDFKDPFTAFVRAFVVWAHT